MAQVTISIPNEQWPDFQKYYFKRLPIPMMDDPENPGEQIPSMSVGDWVKKSIVSSIYQILLEGKQMETFNELEIDINIT